MRSATHDVESAVVAVPRFCHPGHLRRQLIVGVQLWAALALWSAASAARAPSSSTPHPLMPRSLIARLPACTTGLLPTLKADAVFLSPPWGGLDYDEREEGDFDLSTSLQPCCGFRLFDAACATAPAVAYYLPKNTDRAQIAQLAQRHPSHACELQHVVRHSTAIAKRGSNRKPKSKALIAFFDAPYTGISSLAPAPGVREVTIDDPDGASSSAKTSQ